MAAQPVESAGGLYSMLYTLYSMLNSLQSAVLKINCFIGHTSQSEVALLLRARMSASECG